MINFAIIDDDPTFIQVIVGALHYTPDYKCLTTAHSIAEFWENLPQRAVVNIIFLDIDMPGESGIDALPRIKKRFPDAEIIMMTRMDDQANLLKALINGATGYLIKGISVAKIREYLSHLKNGGAAISPDMAKILINLISPVKKIEVNQFHLSPKEVQLLTLFTKGYSYQQTSEIMGITINGVRYYVKEIYKKLNVNNKTSALKIFTEYY